MSIPEAHEFFKTAAKHPSFSIIVALSLALAWSVFMLLQTKGEVVTLTEAYNRRLLEMSADCNEHVRQLAVEVARLEILVKPTPAGKKKK